MSKNIRIRTTPNSDEKYVKVKLEQDFDLLEILSLKIRQEDAYASFCSNYGVVAGRISVNDGFGIPNVRVSIFIPITNEDAENPIINELYPYVATSDQNRNGVRYNLLPKRQQHTDHTPVGTFPEKREVLDDETYIEVYEKYYKYTTKTNDAGDFMLFGVPVGQQQLFYDVDLSDIGFLSLRPFEMMAQGIPEDKFESKFKFKSSNNLDDLPQISSAGVSINVKPFWCDTLNLGREIGITREDIELPIELKPTAIFTGSIFSDDEKDSLNKNCRPRKRMGELKELITSSGKIEMIRRTQKGDIEIFRELGDDLIDENGNWSFQVPMNLRKVVTGEDGTLIPSPDGIKGVATEADVRFRISMNNSGDDGRLRTRAKMLVPNMLENYEFGEFSREELREAENAGDPIFNINDDLSMAPPSYQDDPANEYNYLENFFTFRWKKVYTVRQYIGRFQPNDNDNNRNFIGIKDIAEGFGVNKIPFNRFDTTMNPLYSILCFLLTLFGVIVGIINGIIDIINSLVTMLCQARIPCGIDFISLNGTEADVEFDVSCRVAGTWIAHTDVDFKTPCFSLKDYCADVETHGGTCTNDKKNCLNQAFYDTSSGFMKPKPSANKFIEMDYFMERGWNFCNAVYGGATGPKYALAWSSGPSYPFPQTNFSTSARALTYFHYNSTSIVNGNVAVRLKNSNLGNNLSNCDKCQICNDCPDGTIKILGVCIGFKWLCFLSPLLCSNCDTCEDSFDCNGASDPCSDGMEVGGSGSSECGTGQCCTDCCRPIPLIELCCPANTDGDDPPCYEFKTIPTPFAATVCNRNFAEICPSCNGREFSSIRQWVECTLEPLASVLGVVKFDFYNDWLNGSLYFPLIKRKLKTKRRRKKSGELKKDKFCDYNCYENSVGGYLLDDTLINQPGETNNRRFDLDHGKPSYTAFTYSDGYSVKYNIGGHGHHQNRCNSSYLVEKKEFIKKTNDCLTDLNVNTDSLYGVILNNDVPSECLEVTDTIDDNCSNGCNSGVLNCGGTCIGQCPDNGYNKNKIYHGIIKWNNGNIYYASVIPKDSNGLKPQTDGDIPDDQIKGQLLYPTNITELGSSTFCDIDDQPFIIDNLETTSYRISEQETGKGYVNLNAYVDLGCFTANCVATRNVVLSSQLGIEIYDFRDNGDDLGQFSLGSGNVIQPCVISFDHDDEVREYFCQRFTTYLNNDLEINYMSPSNNLKNNLYDTYPETSIAPSVTNTNVFNQNNGVNDGDFFIPGDKCKLRGKNGNLYRFMYGLNSGNGFNGMDLRDYPTNTASLNNTTRGVSFSTSHTPYYFYFGLVPGKTALHKTVTKFFADKVTLPGDGDGNYGGSGNGNGTDGTNLNDVLATCLNKS